jgi:plasmid maintenance system antidote protein VapI
MIDTNNNLSESERFNANYISELQKVKERFRVKDADILGISEAKASRILNGKQIDIETMLEMASMSGYTFEFKLIER